MSCEIGDCSFQCTRCCSPGDTGQRGTRHSIAFNCDEVEKFCICWNVVFSHCFENLYSPPSSAPFRCILRQHPPALHHTLRMHLQNSNSLRHGLGFRHLDLHFEPPGTHQRRINQPGLVRQPDQESGDSQSIHSVHFCEELVDHRVSCDARVSLVAFAAGSTACSGDGIEFIQDDHVQRRLIQRLPIILLKLEIQLGRIIENLPQILLARPDELIQNFRSAHDGNRPCRR
mmetsp:Transcript_1412/g.3299  ORF Transcript_1412/g.3299 Transcript_1412/m.3299 type:complete len:230 (-) Transcript_1412:670-1359(-)